MTSAKQTTARSKSRSLRDDNTKITVLVGEGAEVGGGGFGEDAEDDGVEVRELAGGEEVAEDGGGLIEASCQLGWAGSRRMRASGSRPAAMSMVREKRRNSGQREARPMRAGAAYG